MNYFIKKESVIKLILILMMISGVCILGRKGNEKQAIQNDIAEKILRFHVRANSDSDFDQELKLKVRDGVIDYMKPYFSECNNRQEAEIILKEHTEDILQVAAEIIENNGYKYRAEAYLKNEYFPVRKYGNIILPEGEYRAYRIDIGEAKGKNWWCIMYPAMCISECMEGDYDYESLSKALTKEEWEYLKDCQIKFKYLTFLN